MPNKNTPAADDPTMIIQSHERRTRLGLQIAAAAAAISIGASVASAQADPVRISIASEPYPPFASVDASGKWVGFEIDLAGSVCKAAKLDCEIVATAWDGMIPALTSKKIDVIWASMAITPARAEQIAFTNPYYAMPSAFIGNKGDKFDFTPEGLKGKTIGVQIRSRHARYVQATYPEAVVKPYATLEAANADLASHQLDLVLADAEDLDDFLNDKNGACCEVKVLAQAPLLASGVAGGVRKEDSDLKAKLDQGIKAVYASGDFGALEKKYFKYDIGVPQ
jgi:polar amino acid transport system substrate-binding protein